MFVPPSTGVEEPIDGAGNMDLGLTGRVALVSAASQGLGRATAMALAAEGAPLAICARGREMLERTAEQIRSATGARVLAVPTDVSDHAAVRAFIARVLEPFDGRIDIL